MVFITKGSQIFDQLPSQFESFFPSEQSLADGKLASVLARAGGTTPGLLTRVQAETITQGLQLVQQQKAILVGDFLESKMPALVSFTTDTFGMKVPQGLFASVPFPTSDIEDPLLNAMAGVGLNLALNAISAIPIAGKIVALIVNIGMALAKLFGAQEEDPALPPLLLPWTRYGRDKDEDLVNKGLILSTAGDVDVPGATDVGQADTVCRRHGEGVDVRGAQTRDDHLEVDLGVIAVLVERALREVDVTGADEGLEHHVGGVTAIDELLRRLLRARCALLDVRKLLGALQEAIDCAGGAGEHAEFVHLLLSEGEGAEAAFAGKCFDGYEFSIVGHLVFSMPLLGTQQGCKLTFEVDAALVSDGRSE